VRSHERIQSRVEKRPEVGRRRRRPSADGLGGIGCPRGRPSAVDQSIIRPPPRPSGCLGTRSSPEPLDGNTRHCFNAWGLAVIDLPSAVTGPVVSGSPKRTCRLASWRIRSGVCLHLSPSRASGLRRPRRRLRSRFCRLSFPRFSRARAARDSHGRQVGRSELGSGWAALLERLFNVLPVFGRKGQCPMTKQSERALHRD
jgi:hypothetical protein